ERVFTVGEGPGEPIGPFTRPITLAMCEAFSGPEKNYHNDREMARMLGFPDIVVQGMLSVCLVSELMTAAFRAGWLLGGKMGVRAALLPIGRSEIELLEPIGADGGVAKFLERRGEGLHHVCFETPDVAAELAAARAKGLPLIDEAPRQGLAGMICFLHPKGTR